MRSLTPLIPTRDAFIIAFGILFLSLHAAASPPAAPPEPDPHPPAHAGAPANEPFVRYPNLDYTQGASSVSDLCKLDLFRANDGKKRPLVLLIHGGSWAGGDKANFERKLVPWWINQGYVVAPVNFRLATKPGENPVVKPTDQVSDIASALAWLVEQAETYGIAREGVVLFGYSSGAHLVALLGTDERYLEKVQVQETQIAAAISLDVHAYDVPFALELMKGSVVERNRPLIQHLFGTSRQEQLSASPIHFVDGWAAPAFIVSVDQDPDKKGTHGYIVNQAASHYADALRKAGHQAETLHDTTADHASLVMQFGDPGDVTSKAISVFIQGLQ